eukprot:GEMP01030859.1.p1 GENE.GEMP01030859.1~~GEMP01030859.1.p1  ORF type:complete len:363 (+),score=56.04 GEMP01030859.1:338-1426(+)
MNFLATLATTLLVVVQSIGDVKQHFPQPPDSEGQLEQSGSYTLAVEKSGKFLRQENPDQQSSDSSLREAPKKMATKKFKPLKQLKRLRRHIREKTVAMKKKAHLVHRMILHGQKGLLPVGRGIDETPFKCKEEDTQVVYQEQERKFDILKVMFLEPNRTCLTEEGTFRTGGTKKKSDALLKTINSEHVGSTADDDVVYACADITTLMKSVATNFLPFESDKCWNIIKAGSSATLEEKQTWLHNHPWYNLFDKWIGLLRLVKEKSKVNLMGCENLVITPGPKLFKSRETDPRFLLSVVANEANILEELFILSGLCDKTDFPKEKSNGKPAASDEVINEGLPTYEDAMQKSDDKPPSYAEATKE